MSMKIRSVEIILLVLQDASTSFFITKYIIHLIDFLLLFLYLSVKCRKI